MDVKVGQIREGSSTGIKYEVLAIHEGMAWLWDESLRHRTFSIAQIEDWEVVKPFFEEGKTYQHNLTGTKVTIHHVHKFEKGSVGVGLWTDGHPCMLDETDFPHWGLV